MKASTIQLRNSRVTLPYSTDYVAAQNNLWQLRVGWSIRSNKNSVGCCNDGMYWCGFITIYWYGRLDGWPSWNTVGQQGLAPLMEVLVCFAPGQR